MKTWKIILFPLAWLYGFGIRIRHWLFNTGILPSRSFPMPVIGVGNLSMGGTGKTPVVDHLIHLFIKNDYQVATLSRGYGRKTRGFLLGDQFSRYSQVGDEPMQYIKHFGNKVHVAVDEKRVRGIQTLIKNTDVLDVVLLDDAFQHRYVKPGLSILLTDYHKLYRDDYLLPVGTLRDTVRSAKRADIILVTKVPKVLSPLTRKRVTEVLRPRANQKIFFSYLKYDKLTPITEAVEEEHPKEVTAIVLFTGIANSYPVKDRLRRKCRDLHVIEFRDHHVYTRKDMVRIRDAYEDIFTQKKIIVTTEKDAMRLMDSPYFSILNHLPLYYLPVRVKLHGDDVNEFNKMILNYVEQNRRNG